MTLEQTVKPHPEVVDTELEEGTEAVLLHLGSKTYYGLNVSGVRIWRGLKDGLSLREISRRLQVEFAVEAEQADRSVLTLVRELAEHQLVEGNEKP